MTRGKLLTVLFSVAAAITVGCGVAPAASPEPSSAPPTPDDRCEQVHPDLVARIFKPAHTKGLQLTAVKAAAIRSDDHPGFYLVAVAFTAPGFDGEAEPGVWAVDKLAMADDEPVKILSVDGFAKRFTDWLPADESAWRIRNGTAEVREAEACVS